ncbi:MAG: type II toxin-antitoxin system VapC family toxin [Thermoanaerobaculia bacterium]|nr:type II toxin-antitoxin system VapC family toxin [Thermoanaerobaculia bacterium]
MSGFLLDTNVISEARKGPRMHPGLSAWFSRRHSRELFLSVLSLAEIRRGIALVGRRDLPKAEALSRWYQELIRGYGEIQHLLPIGHEECDVWGEFQGVRSLPVIDAFLAATARTHRLTLVTRNTADFVGLPIELENPFVLETPHPAIPGR